MFGRKKKKEKEADIPESINLPITSTTSYTIPSVATGATWVDATSGNLYVNAPGAHPVTIGVTSTAGSTLTWNGTNGPVWTTNPQVYGPGSTAGTNYWTSYNTADAFLPINLNSFDKTTLTFQGKSFFKPGTVSITSLFKSCTYNLVGKNYYCFIEQDFTDLSLQVNQVSVLQEKKKRYGILAYDVDLNRLELASILPEDEPKANLEEILDDSLNIKEDKTTYLSSLYGRLVPFVNCKVSNIVHNTPPQLPGKNAVDLSVDLEHSETSGIIPFMHLTNLTFGNLLPASKAEVLEALQKLDTEVICFSKHDFPDVQKAYTPEYGYLTLKHPSVVKQHLRDAISYTKEGLEELLTKICVDGSNPKPFVQELLNCMSLDQRILNIEDRAVVTIKHMIEQNID